MNTTSAYTEAQRIPEDPNGAIPVYTTNNACTGCMYHTDLVQSCPTIRVCGSIHRPEQRPIIYIEREAPVQEGMDVNVSVGITSTPKSESVVSNSSEKIFTLNPKLPEVITSLASNFPKVGLSITSNLEFYANTGILSDEQILDLCEREKFIEPFVNKSVRFNDEGARIFSYGPSSYGYDVRLSTKFRIFSNSTQSELGYLDPHDLDIDHGDKSPWVDYEGPSVIIPPNGFILGYTQEYIRMPRNLTGFISNKSSYARAGINVTTSIIEAHWEGTVVLEISNLTPRPVKVYAGEGVAQFVFFRGLPCKVSYKDRGGKYDGQIGMVMPRL